MSKREHFETPTEVILKNQIIMNDLRQKNQEIYQSLGRKYKFLILTYGCQMNEHDSEKLIAMLETMDFERTEDKNQADVIIFNTCCVRENAELKVLGNLGAMKALKKKNPELKLIVCGCMMQQPHVVQEIKQKYRYVSLVFGTHNLHNFPSLLSKTYGATNTLVEVWEEEGQVIEGLPIERKVDTKAFVNIMYGCNNFCTYCIVPYTRGRERSRAPEAILHEIHCLVKDGVKEITLLGQNVNSYGKTLDNNIDFPDLLEQVSQVEGLKRIRFMTSHPKDISDKLLEVMSRHDNICNYLHLPVQSGSNRILKAMNRHYTKEQYLDIIEKARKLMPDLSVSTDIIVGFPGETIEDNEETIDLIRKVAFNMAFTFMYSAREGTPAAKLVDQLTEAEKHERFNALLKVHNAIASQKNHAMKDQVVEVLVESFSKTNQSILSGRTPHNHVVNFVGGEDLIGHLVNVKITEPKSFSLFGEMISKVE